MFLKSQGRKRTLEKHPLVTVLEQKWLGDGWRWVFNFKKNFPKGVLPTEQHKGNIMKEAALFCLVLNFLPMLWFPLLVGGWLGQRSCNVTKMPGIFLLSWGWVAAAGVRNGEGCWKRRQQWLFASLALQSSSPKTGMSLLLNLKSMWLHPFVSKQDPSSGNRWLASAFAVFSRKGI